VNPVYRVEQHRDVDRRLLFTAKMASLLLVLACTMSAVMAQTATVTSLIDIPEWGSDSAMQLSLSTAGGEPVPLTYTVMPLTQSLGLNQTDTTRGVRFFLFLFLYLIQRLQSRLLFSFRPPWSS
jgi:hypothetical protein